MPVIPAVGRQMQENSEFRAILGYVRPFKKKSQNTYYFL
jgi:hypothetical protein